MNDAISEVRLYMFDRPVDTNFVVTSKYGKVIHTDQENCLVFRADDLRSNQVKTYRVGDNLRMDYYLKSILEGNDSLTDIEQDPQLIPEGSKVRIIHGMDTTIYGPPFVVQASKVLTLNRYNELMDAYNFSIDRSNKMRNQYFGEATDSLINLVLNDTPSRIIEKGLRKGIELHKRFLSENIAKEQQLTLDDYLWSANISVSGKIE